MGKAANPMAGKKRKMEIIKGLFLALTIIIVIGTVYILSTRRSLITILALLVVSFGVLLTTFNLLQPELSNMINLLQPELSSMIITHQLVIMFDSSPNPPSPPPIIITATPPAQLTQPNVTQLDWTRVWPNVARWRPQIEQAATHCSIHSALIVAIMQQESGGIPNICSKAGACGVMQLMPGTATELGVIDRNDVAQSTIGGACYLRKMLDRYNNDLTLAVAAYNAGPGNVDAAGGRIPAIAETQKYVQLVSIHLKKLTAASPQTPPAQAQQASTNQFIWPVHGTITQNPHSTHMALDIAAPLGTPVVACQSGIAYIMSFDRDGYGKYVIVDHQNGQKTLYAHLSSYTIQHGEPVQQGQIIGRIGSTGKSTGPHLHFEVHVSGQLKNPYHYIGNQPP